MRKKRNIFAACTAIAVTSVLFLAGCTQQDDSWKTNTMYDMSLPNLDCGTDENGNSVANADGWYLSMQDDFDGAVLNASTKAWNEDGSPRDVSANPVWTYSPHAVRTANEARPECTSYWCDDMVTLNDGNVRIAAKQESAHVCSSGVCKAANGRFTGGIETRAVIGDQSENKGGNDNLLFSQAYGYYECRVKFPYAEGLWSAFWLQSSTQRKLASEGTDGTEIDIYESAFIKNPTKMGNALLWNGYRAPLAKSDGYINDTDKNLYEGYHTFALKWTPEYYVFYIDGEVNWATMGGGVSRVAEFLRLTVEIDDGDAWGPHGQKIGQFKDNNSEFLIDYVKVYQNKNYLRYVIDSDKFPGDLDLKN